MPNDQPMILLVDDEDLRKMKRIAWVLKVDLNFSAAELAEEFVKRIESALSIRDNALASGEASSDTKNESLTTLREAPRPYNHHVLSDAERDHDVTLPHPHEFTTCFHCGETVATGDKECTRCGGKLS